MVRKRAKPKSIQLGKEKEIDWQGYYKALILSKYLDNLTPLIKDFIKEK